MFSAIKKAFGRDDESGKNGTIGNRSELPGIQQMDTSLQRRFARGIQYNMKIVIRGDRNTGKSCLFHRLQGQSFSSEYMPTEEIQVGIINWSYKTTDDVVKVEVWDVVDHGKQRSKNKSLKVSNTPPALQEAEEPVLDAQWVDVYQGTHGVVMTTDITKPWTLEYVRRELPKVPVKIPVLVLANFRDQGSSRKICRSDFECLVDEANISRGESAAAVRFAESSMKTAFGLKYLHKFFNIPFLLLQRESLELQLQMNNRDMTITERELEALVDSEEQNYEVYCSNMYIRNISIEGVTDQENQNQIKSSVHSIFKDQQTEHSSQVNTSLPSTAEELGSSPNEIETGEDNYLTNEDVTKSTISKNFESSKTISNEAKQTITSKLALNTSISPSQSALKSSPKASPKASPPPTIKDRNSQSVSPSLYNVESVINGNGVALADVGSGIATVEDFVLDDGIDGFLDDAGAEASTLPSTSTVFEDDSESEEERNPMVAADQDDISPEDLTIKDKSSSNSYDASTKQPSHVFNKDASTIQPSHVFNKDAIPVSLQEESFASSNTPVTDEFGGQKQDHVNDPPVILAVNKIADSKPNSSENMTAYDPDSTPITSKMSQNISIDTLLENQKNEMDGNKVDGHGGFGGVHEDGQLEDWLCEEVESITDPTSSMVKCVYDSETFEASCQLETLSINDLSPITLEASQLDSNSRPAPTQIFGGVSPPILFSGDSKEKKKKKKGHEESMTTEISKKK